MIRTSLSGAANPVLYSLKSKWFVKGGTMPEQSTDDAKRQWEESTLAASLKKAPERAEQFETSSGIEIERLYTPDSSDNKVYHDQIGYPGEFPFTRGVQPTMYRS